MTGAPAVPAAHEALPAALRAGLVGAEALRARLSGVSVTPDLDRVAVRGRQGAGEVDLGLLRSLARDGHGAAVVVRESGYSLRISFAAAGAPRLVQDGQPGDLVGGGDDEAELVRAVARHDAVEALSRVAAASATALVELVVRHDPAASGWHWAPSRGLLLELLSSAAWTDGLLALFPGGRPGVGPVDVVVNDAGSDVLAADGLVLRGPASAAARHAAALGPEGPEGTEGSGPYLDRRLADGRPCLPTSQDLLPHPGGGGSLEPCRPVLAGLARATAWYWLASSVTVAGPDAGGVRCVFDGVRQVEVALVPGRPAGADAELDLFRWASATTDPARDEALQQAITFAVESAADLPGAPVPVLRTARSLYELARRGVVSEALATRRSARDAGLASARDAARAARETAGKVVDRSVQLVLAASPAVFASARDLISAPSAFAVLLAISGLAGAALAVALRSEIPAGRAALSSFREDADQYREALSQEDVEALRGLATLGKADADLDRARRTALWLYSAVAVAVLLGGGAALATEVAPSGTPAPGPVVGATPTVAATPSLLPSPELPRPPDTTVPSPVPPNGTPPAPAATSP